MIASPDHTPLRSILHELTATINETGVDPFEGYATLQHSLGKHGLRYTNYLSSSITSGGHARRDDLTMMEVIQKNTDSAFDLADELYKAGQLDANESIEAVAVGKVRHWSQSDYMEFWLSVMARLPFTGPGSSQRLDTVRTSFSARIDELHVDRERYNNPQLAADQRVSEYMRHADAFATVAQELNTSPVTRLVRLIDTDQSLGAQTENYFARVMGTRVLKTAVAHLGDPTLPPGYPSPRLVNDVSSIVSFGGQIFDTDQRTQIVLVPNDVDA